MMNKENDKKNIVEMITNNWLFVCLMAFVFLRGGLKVGPFLMRKVQSMLGNISPALVASDAWRTGFVYICFIGVWIVVFAYLAILKDHRYLLKMASSKVEGNTVKTAAFGLLAGFALNGTCILAASLNGDIHLSFRGFAPLSFLFVLFCVFIQCAAEELIYRGYMYHKLMGKYGKVSIAIILNAFMFSSGHIFNPSVTMLSLSNIILFGVLFTLPMCYMKNGLWWAFGFHTAWNFSQSILFGLPNSGKVFPYYVFTIDAGAAKNSFAYNVGFGVEGTLLATFLLAAFIVIWVVYAKKKNIRPVILADTMKDSSGNIDEKSK